MTGRRDGIFRATAASYLLRDGPAVPESRSTSSSTWMLEGSNEPPLPVFVGNLNGHHPFKATDPTLITLQHAGITPDEYLNILKHDPLVKHDPDHPTVDEIISSANMPDRYLLVRKVIYGAPLE